MTDVILAGITRLKELNEHILISILNIEKQLVCTAFLSEISEKPMIVYSRVFDEETLKQHSEEVIVSTFLRETAAIIFVQIKK